MDMAASGGYYIAMAGDKILAHPTSITGSIGVISMKLNVQALLDKVGVGFEVVKSGDKKDFLSPLRPLTDEERKLFQEIIDGYHGRFVSIIAENRHDLSVEEVKKLADGRVYTADQALGARLIDRIAYLDETEDFIRKDLGLPDIKVVTYHRAGDYKANLYSLSPKDTVINLINVDMDFPSSAPYFMYLWMP
jgi:protease-4